MGEDIRSYLAEIGTTRGRKSRRTLDPETARQMVRVRGARGRVPDPIHQARGAETETIVRYRVARRP
jgi:hypothetical protein